MRNWFRNKLLVTINPSPRHKIHSFLKTEGAVISTHSCISENQSSKKYHETKREYPRFGFRLDSPSFWTLGLSGINIRLSSSASAPHQKVSVPLTSLQMWRKAAGKLKGSNRMTAPQIPAASSCWQLSAPWCSTALRLGRGWNSPSPAQPQIPGIVRCSDVINVKLDFIIWSSIISKERTVDAGIKKILCNPV